MVCFADLEEGGIIGCNSVLSNSMFLDAQHNFDPALSVHMQQESCFLLVQKYQYSAAKAFEKLLVYSDVPGINTKNWTKKVGLLAYV